MLLQLRGVQNVTLHVARRVYCLFISLQPRTGFAKLKRGIIKERNKHVDLKNGHE